MQVWAMEDWGDLLPASLTPWLLSLSLHMAMVFATNMASLLRPSLVGTRSVCVQCDMSE